MQTDTTNSLRVHETLPPLSLPSDHGSLAVGASGRMGDRAGVRVGDAGATCVTAAGLLEQIKWDTRTLNEPFYHHIPSTEFFLDRIRLYTESYKVLRRQEMGLSVTTTTTTTVKLAPKLKQRLLTKFREYQAYKVKLDEAQERLDVLKAEIADLREDTGEVSLDLEGYKTTRISPIREVFDEKKFIADGGDIAIYKGAMKSVPSKPYEKISLPKVAE